MIIRFDAKKQRLQEQSQKEQEDKLLADSSTLINTSSDSIISIENRDENNNYEKTNIDEHNIENENKKENANENENLIIS